MLKKTGFVLGAALVLQGCTTRITVQDGSVIKYEKVAAETARARVREILDQGYECSSRPTSGFGAEYECVKYGGAASTTPLVLPSAPVREGGGDGAGFKPAADGEVPDPDFDAD